MVLVVGGLVLLAIYLLYLKDAPAPLASDPNRNPSNTTFYYAPGLVILAGSMVLGGLFQLVRGIRGRSR